MTLVEGAKCWAAGQKDGRKVAEQVQVARGKSRGDMAKQKLATGTTPAVGWRKSADVTRVMKGAKCSGLQ